MEEIKHEPLLLCPYCGGPAALHYKSWVNSSSDGVPHLNPRVECMNCGASTRAAITTIKDSDETWQQVWEEGVIEAVNYWNRRV